MLYDVYWSVYRLISVQRFPCAVTDRREPCKVLVAVLYKTRSLGYLAETLDI